MQKASLQKESDGQFNMHGVLNFDSVIDIHKQALGIIDAAKEKLIFDLSLVTQSNSAGLALLTTLLRYAKQKNKQLRYVHLPAKLLSAAKISDLDQLLT